jgi:hypothetical protein
MHEQETHAPRQVAEGTVCGKREVGSRAARRGATAFGDTPPWSNGAGQLLNQGVKPDKFNRVKSITVNRDQGG